jgi:hypothetical protein
VNAGKFAFYAVPGLADCYYIYSVDAKKWVNYNKDNRNNQKSFVELSENFNAYAYWEIKKATKKGDNTPCYQMRPTQSLEFIERDENVALALLNYRRGDISPETDLRNHAAAALRHAVNLGLLHVHAGDSGGFCQQIGSQENTLAADAHERNVEGLHLHHPFDGDLGIDFAKRRLDPLLERHHRERTASAVTDEFEIDGLAFNAHQFQIAAVGLQSAAKFLEFRLDLLFHLLSPLIRDIIA